MEKSESIAKLAVALVAFQSMVATIGTDKKNPFFKSDYATLGQLIEETKALRHSNGLAVTQMPIGEGGLITMLLHSSGEYISATSQIRLEAGGKNSLAQEAGKLITYQRRYAYAAILGLVSDKDADGNLKDAMPATPTPPTKKVKQTPSEYIKANIANVDEQEADLVSIEVLKSGEKEAALLLHSFIKSKK